MSWFRMDAVHFCRVFRCVGNRCITLKITKNVGCIKKNIGCIKKNIGFVNTKTFLWRKNTGKMMTLPEKWGFLPMGAENDRYIVVSSTLEPSHTFPRYLLHPINPPPEWKFGLKACLTTPICMMTWGFLLEKVTPTGGVSMCSRAAFCRPRLVCFGPFGARARRFSKPKVHFGSAFSAKKICHF